MMSETSEGSQASMVEDISHSFLEQLRIAPFACGGSVPVSSDEPEDSSTQPAQPRTTKPVHIRFGSIHGEGGLVSLPTEHNDTQPLQVLLKLCAPAPFGRGKEEVLDDAYHKASKLDPAQFATTFCPYECGIVDVVAQLLLPEARHAGQSRGVRAELYKLNVYSGPCGKFKAHVDTPRGVMQFGSLVVALPIDYDGTYSNPLIIDLADRDCRWAAGRAPLWQAMRLRLVERTIRSTASNPMGSVLQRLPARGPRGYGWPPAHFDL